MNFIKKFFRAIFREDWVQSMEAESRSWMVRCSCGFERSIWEMGGIRWKASGTPKQYLRCPACGQSGWHTTYRKTLER